MIPFKLYIDLSGGKNPDGYFEVNAISVAPFKDEQIDGMVVKRKDWGEVRIKNEPFNYIKLGGDRYKLYDIITAQKPNQEIHIKFVSAYETIYGYFGIVDCKVDDDHKVLSINVTTLDQYTNFLENREEEIKLFDEGNVIANGNFDTWINNMPVGWNLYNYNSNPNYNLLKLEQKYVLDESCVAISDYGLIGWLLIFIGGWDASTGNVPSGTEIVKGCYMICEVAGTYNGVYYNVGDYIVFDGISWVPSLTHKAFNSNPMGIVQQKTNVLKNGFFNLSLFYAVTGTSEKRKYVYCDVFLSDSKSSDVYRLLSDGTWTKDLVNSTKILVTGGDQRVCVPIGDLQKYYNFNISSGKVPVDGTIELVLYRPENADEADGWDNDYKLLFTTVILSVTSIELKTINIKLETETLTTVKQEKLFWESKVPDDYCFIGLGLSIEALFNGDGSPKLSSIPCVSRRSLSYADLLGIFQDSDHPSYKYEISEITLFKGNLSTIYAEASFSREEIYIVPVLYTQEDADNGICEQDKVGTERPPEKDAGWGRTGRTDASGRVLWCRTPFNGATNTWQLEPINTSTTLRRYKGFYYKDRITSTKQYPSREGSEIKVNNGIDLRELITQVYTKTHPSLLGKNVYSNFLWNDALTEQEEKLVYVGNPTTCNYVTMTDDIRDAEAKNVLNKVLAVHTYEFIPSDSRTTNDDDKSILKTSAKKLFDDLLIMFPEMYWFIDATGNLHFEHIKYFDRVNTAKDLTKEQYELRNYQEWEYIKDKMYSKEEYETKNSAYVDFNKSIVTFDKIVSNKRGEDIKGTFNTTILSTDVQYCAENPTSLDNGIVLMAYETVNGENYVKYGAGQYSGKKVINGDLSISTLLQQYGTYEGTWIEGLINGKGNNPYGKQTYFNTRRVRQGKEITVKGIVLSDVIYTNLGLGLVKSRTIDYEREKTMITAIYRYGDKFLNVFIGGGDVIEPELPTIGLVASPISNIAQTTATFNGVITSDGGSPVTERGFIYGTTNELDLTHGTKVTTGTGTGLHFANITGLTPSTVYCVREYAINSVGVAYGQYSYSFNTAANAMAVTTVQADVINEGGSLNAHILSTITSAGGKTVVYGVVWSFNENPTYNDNVVFVGIGTEGDYEATIPDIIAGETYYARAYISDATNPIVYGNVVSFNSEWDPF